MAEHQDIVTVVLTGDRLDTDGVVAAAVDGRGFELQPLDLLDRGFALQVVAISGLFAVIDLDALQFAHEWILANRKNAAAAKLPVVGDVGQRQVSQSLARRQDDWLLGREAECEIGLLPPGTAELERPTQWCPPGHQPDCRCFPSWSSGRSH